MQMSIKGSFLQIPAFLLHWPLPGFPEKGILLHQQSLPFFPGLSGKKKKGKRKGSALPGVFFFCYLSTFHTLEKENNF